VTASTEHQTNGARPHVALSEAHLEGALKLTRSANWNQNAADWRTMLALGRAWGITASDGSLAASTLVLPYGSTFAWVSMVLVAPEHRRKGYASQLLRTAIAHLQTQGLMPVLDATPAGHDVYVQEGFRDTWGFKRYALKAASVTASPALAGVRPLEEGDWPRVLALDGPAFGASREPLLRSLAARLPAAALVIERQDSLAGFLLGRDGHEARQLGPLVAEDADAAIALLAGALSQVPPPVYVDVTDHAWETRAWLESRGFEFQRPFTRMVHGGTRAPGNEAKLVLVAGPELG
jgi:GNAT superfamily N-acetyltransferase